MKSTFKWMFAVILICGLTITSCKKDPQPTPIPDPEPTTQTVLASIVGTGVPFYDSVTYTYEYDAEYRIVRSESHVTNESHVIQDLRFTYSDGHISVVGTEDEKPLTIECTLNEEGLITHFVKTEVVNDTITQITNVDLTYDEGGRLTSQYSISDVGQGVTNNYVWEGDDLVAANMEGGPVTIEYVPSDAPAQALLDKIGYNLNLKDLCTQGCFGKLPAHMPAQGNITTTIPIPGMAPIVETINYTYTVNADGRLATCLETGGTDNRTTNYIFNWEER